MAVRGLVVVGRRGEGGVCVQARGTWLRSWLQHASVFPLSSKTSVVRRVISGKKCTCDLATLALMKKQNSYEEKLYIKTLTH